MTKMDRWLFWPTLASVAVVAVLTFACELPGLTSFVMIPTSVIGYAIATIGLLEAVLFFAATKRPRRAASFLLSLILPVGLH
jgi:hypothetical protein